MKKSDRNLLQARLAQISQPSPTREPKPDATDEINALFGGGSLPGMLTSPSSAQESTGATSLPGPVKSAETEQEHQAPTPRTPRTPATPRTSRTPRTPPTGIAPERDYTKVANSIVREAVAGGYFTGKSKQLYDFLYARTRGAIVPRRSISITKPQLMKGSGIGSERTLLKNIAHLKSIRLLEVAITDGKHGGNEYTVLLPEEVNLPPLPTPPTPPTAPTPQHGRHAPQEVGYVPPVESGVRGVGLSVLESDSYSEPKTSFKDVTKTSDDDEAFAPLVSAFKKVTEEISGRAASPTEASRWEELANVIIAELKIAAARTTVSSVPSFLAEHLRRRLWKVDKRQARAEGRELPDEAMKTRSSVDASKCPDCAGSGWWYPEGMEKGVKKCIHEKLLASQAGDQKSLQS